MRDIKWTDRQESAICEKNTNLLVSAAAGSGKTAVLVERIIRLILEGGTDIDRFLVVTFTKAAAAEMKEKLVRAVRAQIRVETDPEKRAFLHRQLDRMYLANISTFHSFAIGVVRRFFQYADVDPTVRVIDEGEADILLWDAMEDVFRALFDENDPAFVRFLDRHSRNGGEESLRQALLKDYNRLRSIPHYLEWLEDNLTRLTKPVPAALQGEALAYLRSVYLDALNKARCAFGDLYELLRENGVETFAVQIEAQLDAVDEMIRICTEQDDFRQCITSLPAASLAQTQLNSKAKAEEKAAYQTIKDRAPALLREAKKYLSDLQKVYLKRSDSEEETMMRQTAEDGAVYLGILRRLEVLYKAEKKDRRVIDYSDIEHLAIRVLSNEDAASIYRSQFAYIFIDEYQDSNYLQEEIISRIAGEDNLFMVGDVKQSIYRFRMAEPDIFLHKYHRYAVSEGTDKKIDLNDNFRSKAGVIEGVNFVFRDLMDGYDENAALHQGAPNEKDIDYPVDLYLLDRTADAVDETGKIDEELAEMKWQEKEALMICGKIKALLGKPIYDAKADTVRGIRLKDIVILMRSIKQAGPVYKDVFRREGLGVFVADTSSFFETMEIQTFLDLLRLLDNPQRDLALLGVLRSFFFDYKINDLIRIRMHDKTVPFYQAFSDYAERGENAQLRLRCRDTAETLGKWRREAAYLPLDELIGRLLHDTGYFGCMGAVPGGQQRQANLRTLADKARGLMEMGRNRIQDLLRYVESLQARGNVDVGQTSILGENDDVVRIMTIHKSKGLEFPVVFVSGLGAGAGRGTSGGFAVIDKEMGCALPYVDTEKRCREELLLKTLIREKQKRQEEEEDIRVLYVAMTRAQDKLILTAAIDPLRESSSYYYGKLAPVLEKENCPIRVTEESLPAGSSRTMTPERISIDTLLKPYLANRDPAMRDTVGELLSAVYPYEAELTAKSKYSVSELNHHEELKPPVIRLPRFFQTDEEEEEQNRQRAGSLTGAALGTILHTAMEHLPLNTLLPAVYPDGETTATEGLPEKIDAYLDGLAAQEILTQKERASVDPEMIVRFLTSPVGKRLRHAAAIRRETPFTCTFSKDGRDVLVQGIIDCWFVEDGKIVLLDYKSNMKTDKIRELYQAQIDLYREALEELTGMPVKESYLYLLRDSRLVEM